MRKNALKYYEVSVLTPSLRNLCEVFLRSNYVGIIGFEFSKQLRHVFLASLTKMDLTLLQKM